VNAVHYRYKKDYYSIGISNAPNFYNIRRFGINEAGKLEIILYILTVANIRL
jgi:hypothetical protein